MALAASLWPTGDHICFLSICLLLGAVLAVVNIWEVNQQDLKIVKICKKTHKIHRLHLICQLKLNFMP